DQFKYIFRCFYFHHPYLLLKYFSPRLSGTTDSSYQLELQNQMAASPDSPVRILTTSSMGMMNILPSPILPVREAFMMVSTTLPAISDETTTSILILGIR